VLWVQPNELEQFLDARQALARGNQLMNCQRGAHNLADGLSRVERGIRVLEDHLDVTANRLEVARRRLGDVVAVVEDLPARRLLQAGDQPTRCRLAGPGLSNEAERLADADAQ
jgi:hypothetical protein